jgi:hypothetical protein
MTLGGNNNDFPPDLASTAQKAASEWFRAIGTDEHHFWEAIARAMLGERERCAKLVDAHRPDASFDDSSAGYVERDALLKNIAAEIRGVA